jgi:hypothetical protein
MSTRCIQVVFGKISQRLTPEQVIPREMGYEVFRGKERDWVEEKGSHVSVYLVMDDYPVEFDAQIDAVPQNWLERAQEVYRQEHSEEVVAIN